MAPILRCHARRRCRHHQDPAAALTVREHHVLELGEVSHGHQNVDYIAHYFVCGGVATKTFGRASAKLLHASASSGTIYRRDSICVAQVQSTASFEWYDVVLRPSPAVPLIPTGFPSVLKVPLTYPVLSRRPHSRPLQSGVMFADTPTRCFATGTRWVTHLVARPPSS